MLLYEERSLAAPGHSAQPVMKAPDSSSSRTHAAVPKVSLYDPSHTALAVPSLIDYTMP